ncbi:MAG: L-aspartate oxidase [Lachnospiraceae bacterium]|nr:L-aspartate oxidase [Lachnospiraceae bacterium]
MNHKCDVVIVGTGAAGLFSALRFPEDVNIHMVTKRKVDESDSYLAQGGISVLLDEDDYDDYFEDTMRAGHFENKKDAVDVMIRSSKEVIDKLIEYGVDFERDADGNLLFTKEGAHSQARILFHEDETGREITSTLLKRVRERKNITIHEYITMIDVIEKDNVCGGIVVVNEDKELSVIEANDVILACGGIGGLYKNSTNFPHITGDAISIAIKHGVEVENLDYVQIHPTTLYSKNPGRRFLISESVRGEGAILLDKNGNRFTDELQPRDVVTEAIRQQMKIDGTEYVLEDMRPLGKQTILHHFPNIYERCKQEGYDVVNEPIPVVPAQHYHMGGVKVDLNSESTMHGLYVVGEASCNGVHGKNRLASNSLLEALVFAKRAAENIIRRGDKGCDNYYVDLEEYKDLEGLFDEYRTSALKKIAQ